MNRFFKLIQNEWMKLIHKTSTWVMVGMLIALVFLVSGIIKWDQTQRPQTDSWQEVQEQQLDAYQQQLTHGQLSDDEEKYYEAQIQLIKYRLDHHVAPASEGTFWSSVVGSKNFFLLIDLFTVVVSAGIVANEFSRGTIKLLAIRPISRGKILYSKYLTTLLFGLFLIVILFLTTLLASIMFFPVQEATYLTIEHGNIIEHSMLVEVFKWYLFSASNLVVMTTIAFMIATIFRSSALAIGISLFLLFTAQQVVLLLSSYNWVKYILFANSDLTQFLMPFPLFKDISMTFSISIMLVYLLVFHLITYLVFIKKDIAA